MRKFKEIMDKINNYTEDSSNIGYKKQKRAFFYITVILLILLISIFVVNNMNQDKNELLMANTPLKNHSYFYSMDNFPKYKMDMVKKVEKLMKNGVSEEEACLIAIEETSDKIYKDKLAFTERNSSLEADELEEKYMEYLDRTQK